jgi:Tol biopolymer transport system component
LRYLISDTSRYGYDSPAWSVRNRIAFVRTRIGGSQGQIYAMNVDGSGVAPLTHGAPGFGQPSWSPDGKAIAFVAVTMPLQFAGVIEVANADGTGRHRVSPPSWTSYSPTWSPDGRVVFLVKRDARTSAYIVNRDGSGMRLLYPNLGDALQIAWGPTTLPPASC